MMFAGMSIAVALVVTFPILLSIAAYGWSSVFGDPHRFPGSPRVHRFLVICQFAGVTAVYAFPSSYSLYLLASIYAGQGFGAAYYIHKKGRVDCGCLGPQVQSKLGLPLVVINILFAGICIISSITYGFISQEVAEPRLVPVGLLLEAMLLLLSLVVIVGVPDAVHAIRLYRRMAARHAPKVLKRKERAV